MPLDKKPAPSSDAHAKAAGMYGASAQKHAPSQRETEGRILIKAANMLKDARNNWDKSGPDDLEAALKYNRQIWMVFYDTALEDADSDRPKSLRSNIVNLANFIFKRELEILADPKKEKLEALISINLEIAEGLLSAPTTQNKSG